MSDLKTQIIEEMQTAMRAGDKARVGAMRLITAAFKQVEVDKRIELTDADAQTILNKLAKQRRESIQQYQQAKRDDLVAQEQYELDIIQAYLPEALSEAEVDQLIAESIETTGASAMQDMGKVMAELKPKLQNRADLSMVSAKVKQRLA